MILVVDDDAESLGQIEAALRASGFDVATFLRVHDALDAAFEPELVVSDVVMPEMDGFGFRVAYERKHPERRTPFVFLSSLSDDTTVVQGLALGADDYLTKPVSVPILVAKVRSILRRRGEGGGVEFRGDLETVPFVSVLRFCELKGLTGSVRVSAAGVDACVAFKAGEMRVDDDEQLGLLCDLTQGSFVIRSTPARFDDVAGVEENRSSVVGLPVGRLSTVEVGRRRLLVQTQVVGGVSGSVVTLVMQDGQTLFKRTTRLDGGESPQSIQDCADRQHGQVEGEVASKVEAAREQLARSVDDPRARFNRLFDEGYERYREGKWCEAVQAWEEAQALAPDNNTVQINLQVARAKLR